MNGVIHQSGGSMEHDTWEFETDNSLLHPKGNILPKWKINHGFDNDDAGSNKHRKQTEGGNLSSGRTDLISGYDHRSSRNTSLSSKSLDRFTERSATSDIDRKNVGYYGDMKYFVDDNDETETLTVNSDDNWLLRNPNQELDVIVGPKYNKDYENSTHSLGPIAQSDNSTGKNNNQMGKSNRVETAYSTGSIHE